MKLKLKEDPREWRKSTLLTALGLALLSGVLAWRHVLPASVWRGAWAALGLVALAACLNPAWFRGWYRLSARMGFFLSQALARVVLVLIFLLILTPMALVRRGLGQDPLRLKRPAKADSYWQDTREPGSLDRLF